MSSRVVVTGPSGSSPRLEIHDLIKDKVQWTLYILALRAMYADNQSLDVSHFALGGIHGFPYKQWQGSGGTTQNPKARWGGYCTHGTVLFPTWHRPYLAIYEQVLQQHAKDIANQYTNKTKWINAANTLRIPYWDWASTAVPPDEVIMSTSLNITMPPDEAPRSVENPLRGYPFHPIPSGLSPPFSYWSRTVRYAIDDGSATPREDIVALKRALQSEYQQTVRSTYRLFTINGWDQMSNHTSSSPSGANSLESIHDNIHGLLGGNGHMSRIPYAGFDPIFYLHHANVDRMLALWQAIHYDVWVSQGPSLGGTWTLAANQNVDATTNLTPFWNGPSSYWSSASVRDCRQLNYDYPEFASLDRNNPDAVRAAISKTVNRLYGSGGNNAISALNIAPLSATSFVTASKLGVSSSTTASNPGATKEDVSVAPGAASESPAMALFVSAAGGATRQAQKPLAVESKPNPVPPATDKAIHLPANILPEWTARIRCKLSELSDSLYVLLFFSPVSGPIPENSAEWRSAPSFVGSCHFFVNSFIGNCDNCQNNANGITEGFVHLNHVLAQRLNLASLDPSVIVPILKENLHWRILKADGTAVPVSDVSSLVVDVICTSLTYNPGDMFPKPGDIFHYPHVTRGRPGGHRVV